MNDFDLIRAILDIAGVEYRVYTDNYDRPVGLSAPSFKTENGYGFPWNIRFQHDGRLLFWYT